jgi:hypothetical protein
VTTPLYWIAIKKRLKYEIGDTVKQEGAMASAWVGGELRRAVHA